MILIYMMVLCTQVNKMYVIATLSVYPHRASLKNMPGHGGIRTYDLWNASLGSNPTVARHIFQACPVWIYTQSSNYIHREQIFMIIIVPNKQYL